MAFCDNQIQAYTSKCHALLSTGQHLQINWGAPQIEISSNKKLLGVTNDAQLSLEKHIEQIYA